MLHQPTLQRIVRREVRLNLNETFNAPSSRVCATVGRFVFGVLIFFIAGAGIAETNRLIARGWQPGEYFCIGPDSNVVGVGERPNSILYHTTDYCRSIEAIQPDGRGIMWMFILSDASEGCCYGAYDSVDWDNDPNHSRRFNVRTFDRGENWEEIETEIEPITTGMVPGECYTDGQGDSIRYSTDYGSSYQSLPSNGRGYNGFLVGHQDSEIYEPRFDLWRSEDYGRSFSVVNGGEYDEIDSLAFSNHMWLARGALDGELYLLDEGYFRIFRSIDHGQTWRMQCDLLRDDYDEHGRSHYVWDIKAGADSGEVVIYGFEKVNLDRGWPYGGTIKFLVSRDYGQHFELNIPFDYPPHEVKEPPPALPQLFSLSVFPNPFNGRCRIEFRLLSPQDIRIEVMDLNGRLIEPLTQGYYRAGAHSLLWPSATSNTLLSGSYFLSFNSLNTRSQYKLVIIK